jgi:hypothetical protein
MEPRTHPPPPKPPAAHHSCWVVPPAHDYAGSGAHPLASPGLGLAGAAAVIRSLYTLIPNHLSARLTGELLVTEFS